ncbi:MAG: 2,5-diamino-6-(5-phosphoribosylamino)pyrimidin-4(3H)-one reductase [Verrucomicrobiales bacterium]|nr:2,5-diamino-6-(5-phosphoribosylamino)pyrimidin-4(3H)-one reductase [Verrucomicrobiales bacterium]
MSAELPFVYLNVATTADGKLSSSKEHFTPFGSKRDQELLLALRSQADAVMSGARTINSFPMDLGPGGEKYRKMRIRNGLAEYNIRVVVSGSGNVDPEAKLFQRRFSPIIVLATERAGKKLKRLREVADAVETFGETEIDFVAALRWLKKKWNVNRLLCEGGGEVNGALFRANVVNELYLTLCPVIFGGRDAPTLADGEGIQKLADATRLKMKSMKRVGDELFLVYKVLP